MPRPIRIEYPGAIYHVMNCGDRREAIYRDDEDRATFSPSFRSFTSERSSPPKLRFIAQDHRGSSASQTTAFRSATLERGPKEAFDGAVARSPIEPGKGRVVHAAEVRGSSAGQSVGDASGTGALVVVDLTGRTLQVAVVVEPLQTAEHLLTAPADEISDLVRTEKAGPIHYAKNPRVARSHFHRSKCVCAPKARMPGERHPHILP